MGQGYASQRPSSAGHSRPQTTMPSSMPNNQGIPLSQLLGSHQYPTAASNMPQYSQNVNQGINMPQGMTMPNNSSGGGTSGRPKSAGTSRPQQQQQQNPQAVNMANIYAGTNNMTAQQIYMQQQHQLQQQQQQQQYKMQQHLQQQLHHLHR